MSRTDVIIIECRPPRSKEERKFYGLSLTEGQSTIFVNSRKNRSKGDVIDTIYHEFTHSILNLYHGNHKLSGKDEEKLSRLMGNLARDAFKQYFKEVS